VKKSVPDRISNVRQWWIERNKGISTANLAGVVEVPDLQNIIVNATNAVDQNFAFKFAALAEIPPIFCNELVRSSFR
jgi:hypothetical protein